ncbi:MAG: class I SAM-dependent methyltransferase [Candidatus Lokiarchaeota archaeon]|nr:class I SAM-dependent methyltransferase [Candidatus Lokiarchaeota archaeon]
MTRTTSKPDKHAAESKAKTASRGKKPGRKPTEDHVFYQLPLYYDIVFGSDVLAEVEFYKRLFKEFSTGKVRRVLEPACGSGHYMVLLGKAGFHVTGYDLSPSMVEYTRARIERAGLSKTVQVLEADMRNATLPGKFDVAINQINSLAYLKEDEEIVGHFKATADALVDGGLYIVELTLRCADFEKEHKVDESWAVERDGVRVAATWKPVRYDFEKKLRIVELTMVVDDHGKHSEYFETHELRLWTHEDIKRLTHAGGFDIIASFDCKFNPIPDGTCITGDTHEFPYFVLRKR